MSSDTKPCPVSGCNQSCEAAEMMCGGCWELVPDGMKRLLLRIYPNNFGSPAWIAAYELATDHVSCMLKERSDA